MLNQNRSHKHRLGALLGLAFLIAGLVSVAAPLPVLGAVTAGRGSTHPRAVPPNWAPTAVDAYAHFLPNPVFTATVGTKFTLDLYINSGSNIIVGQQSYMTFTTGLLQVVSTGMAGCVPASTISPDATIFDVALQNVVNNGTGEIAYASGTFGAGVPPASDFRVAQISFCASATGQAVVHWQFSPPAPANRNSKITDSGSNTVSNPALYVDGVIHIVVLTPTATSTPTRTPTNIPTSTPTSSATNTSTTTPTNTNTSTRTSTATSTSTQTATTAPTTTNTNTATNTPTGTVTPLPTNTRTNTATNTATSTRTSTSTNTPTGTTTPLPTNTRTSTATNTATASNSPTRTNTSTATNTPTRTNTSTPTNTATNTPTGTTTPLPTNTRTNTATSTHTRTTTSTPSSTATRTPMNTPIPTQTSEGNTVTPVPTNTPSAVASATPTVMPTVCTIEFSDVPPTSTFYTFIHCLACRGIINGYSSGCETGNPCFRPGNLVTRGQLAKIASNSAGFNEPAGSQQYEDVPIGSTFFEYIWRLTDRGYVNGYPCGGPGEPCGPGNQPYFRPAANVTRGQMSKIVANAAGLGQAVGARQYEDVSEGSTFYDFIWSLTDLGVMEGYPCGGDGEPCGGGNLPYFRPGANATRGQASKIVANTFFPGCRTP
jgi:hypothetical protein